jgi:hypothetical protein
MTFKLLVSSDHVASECAEWENIQRGTRSLPGEVVSSVWSRFYSME